MIRRHSPLARRLIVVAGSALVLAGLEVRTAGPRPGADLAAGPVRLGGFVDRGFGLASFGPGDPRVGRSSWWPIGERGCVFLAWRRNGGRP